MSSELSRLIQYQFVANPGDSGTDANLERFIGYPAMEADIELSYSSGPEDADFRIKVETALVPNPNLTTDTDWDEANPRYITAATLINGANIPRPIVHTDQLHFGYIGMRTGDDGPSANNLVARPDRHIQALSGTASEINYVTILWSWVNRFWNDGEGPFGDLPVRVKVQMITLGTQSTMNDTNVIAETEYRKAEPKFWVPRIQENAERALFSRTEVNVGGTMEAQALARFSMTTQDNMGTILVDWSIDADSYIGGGWAWESDRSASYQVKAWAPVVDNTYDLWFNYAEVALPETLSPGSTYPLAFRIADVYFNWSYVVSPPTVPPTFITDRVEQGRGIVVLEFFNEAPSALSAYWIGTNGNRSYTGITFDKSDFICDPTLTLTVTVMDTLFIRDPNYPGRLFCSGALQNNVDIERIFKVVYVPPVIDTNPASPTYNKIIVPAREVYKKVKIKPRPTEEDELGLPAFEFARDDAVGAVNLVMDMDVEAWEPDEHIFMPNELNYYRMRSLHPFGGFDAIRITTDIVYMNGLNKLPSTNALVSPSIQWNSTIYRTKSKNLRMPSTSYVERLFRVGTSSADIPKSISTGMFTRNWFDNFYPTTHGYTVNTGKDTISNNSSTGVVTGEPDLAAMLWSTGSQSNPCARSDMDPIRWTSGNASVDSAGRPTWRPIDDNDRFETVWCTTKHYGDNLTSNNINPVWWIFDNKDLGGFSLTFEHFNINSEINGPPFNRLSPFRHQAGDVLCVYDGTAPGLIVDDGRGNVTLNMTLLSQARLLAGYSGARNQVTEWIRGGRIQSNPANGGFTTEVFGPSKLLLVIYTDGKGTDSGFKVKAGPKIQQPWVNYDINHKDGEIWMHEWRSISSTLVNGAPPDISDAIYMDYDFNENSVFIDRETCRLTFENIMPEGTTVFADFTCYDYTGNSNNPNSPLKLDVTGYEVQYRAVTSSTPPDWVTIQPSWPSALASGILTSPTNSITISAGTCPNTGSCFVANSGLTVFSASTDCPVCGTTLTPFNFNFVPYEFRVRTKLSKGVSAWTAVITSTSTPITTLRSPDMPTNLRLVLGADNAALNWVAPTGGVGDIPASSRTVLEKRADGITVERTIAWLRCYVGTFDDLVDYLSPVVYVSTGPDIFKSKRWDGAANLDGLLFGGNDVSSTNWIVNKDVGMISLSNQIPTPIGRLTWDYTHHTYLRLVNDGAGDFHFEDPVIVNDITDKYPGVTWGDVKITNEGAAAIENMKITFIIRGYSSRNDGSVEQVLDINRPWDQQEGAAAETFQRTKIFLAGTYGTISGRGTTASQLISTWDSADGTHGSNNNIAPRGRIFGRIIWRLIQSETSASGINTTRGVKIWSGVIEGRYYNVLF